MYRHWIEEEVPYIIATEERKAFFALHTDLERDNYISAFWEARNPTPGAAFNAFKEEHYRRLDYVNHKFGSPRYGDGWRTDMGRIYVTLGPPQLTTPYHLTANIRDLEVWFYQGKSPALPMFFNILFFRPGAGEDYKIYSPRSDGPYRLVTTGQQDSKAALKIIGQQLGPEMSHIALSLIPSEPVDLTTGEPSMDSDLMLNTIRNLADNPLEEDRVAHGHARETAVSSVIVTGPSDLETTIYRDERARLTLSYLLRNHAAIPALIGKRKDGKTGYSLTLRTRLFTDGNKLIYEQENMLEGALTEAQATIARGRLFGAEDRLPVIPGSFNIEVSLRNNLTSEATLFHDRLTVPAVPSNQLNLSPLEVYGKPSPIPVSGASLPFAVAGLRFSPHFVRTATIHGGDQLPIVFQIQLPAASAASPRPDRIHIHYAVGTVAPNAPPPVESDEEITTSNADAAGNILSGHTLETTSLTPGTYRVVVHATGASGTLSASSSLQLHVVTSDTPIDIWTAYGPEPPEATSLDDIKRGLIAEAVGNWDEAVAWYAACLKESPDDPRSLHRLAEALSHLGRSAELAALASQPQLTRHAQPETALLIANALDSTGATPRAISLTEQQLALQPPSPALLNALARFYEHSGDTARAREYRSRAHALAPAS